MKKNWMQALCLVLNVVLLVRQIGQLNELREAAETDQNRMSEELRTLRNRVADLSSEMRESAELIEDYTLEPTGIDAANHALEADAVLKLKSWSEGSTVALTVTAGFDTNVTVLPVDGTGNCRGRILVPVSGEDELRMEAAITSGGVTTREDLGSWGNIFMLLPLRTSGSGWSGPTYREGVLESNFDIVLENPGGTEVIDPVFRVYRNEKLVQEIGAEISDTMTAGGDQTAYAPELPDQTLRLECVPGDTVRITFSCRDGYGLGYEFPFAVWIVDAETPDNQSGAGASSGSDSPILTWPE